MSTRRLVDRVPSARVVSSARLYRHRLKFHKKSKDGSAKCDAEHTNNRSDVVYGVVFSMLAEEKSALDRYEGLGIGYEDKLVSVVTPYGHLLESITYCATEIDPCLKPYEWYKEHVLRGAYEHGLPQGHIASIEAVSTQEDPNGTRHELELSIYR